MVQRGTGPTWISQQSLGLPHPQPGQLRLQKWDHVGLRRSAAKRGSSRSLFRSRCVGELGEIKQGPTTAAGSAPQLHAFLQIPIESNQIPHSTTQGHGH